MIESQFFRKYADIIVEAEKAICDYDQDGRIESPKDEYFGSRFCAADIDDLGNVEEAILDEKAAPGQEEWIKSHKQDFIKQYGKDKGLQVLYATAWKRHNSN